MFLILLAICATTNHSRSLDIHGNGVATVSSKINKTEFIFEKVCTRYSFGHSPKKTKTMLVVDGTK